jgi:hypothetical protein
MFSKLIIMLLLSVVSVFSDVGLGLKAGVNGSTFWNNSLTELNKGNTNFNYDIGTFVEFGIYDWFSIQPEIHFNRRGLNKKLGSTIDCNKSEFIVRTYYLELPILIKYTIFKNYFFYYGGKLDYLLKSKYIYNEYEWGDKITSKDNINLLPYSNSVGAGICFGIGLNVMRVSFDLRYSVDFTKIFENDMPDPWDDQRNEYISFLIGFKFK